MACPRSDRKNLACRGFKQGPPRLQTSCPCHQINLSVVSTWEDWNRMHRQISHCVKFHRHILTFFCSKGILTWKNGERWWFSPNQKNHLLDRETILSLYINRKVQWGETTKTDIRPEGHENASSSNSSFTCSSLNEVQQKFPHVKGWVVKKITAIMFHKERPVTQHWTEQAYSILSQVVSC